MSEQLATLPDEALKAALTDAAMTGPDGLALFDTAIFDIRLGGDSSVNDATGTFTLPLPKIVIAIGTPYGGEEGYAQDDAGENYVDCELWLPFTVFANTGADQRDARQRFAFVRDARQAVLSNHGLGIVGGTVRSGAQQYDASLGLTIARFGWRVWYGRSSVA